MKVAHCQISATATGAATAVLSIVLILAMLRIGIRWLGASAGLFVGLLGSGALAAAVCGALVLLANIREVLEESRAYDTDSSGPGKIPAVAMEASEKWKTPGISQRRET